MSMATTQREILDHTLSAVCEITPAEVGVVLQPDGDRYLHGDRDLAEALAGAVAGSRCCLGRAGGMTGDFSSIGLPSALTAGLSTARWW